MGFKLVELKGNSIGEIEVKKSRFIAYAFPCRNIDELKEKKKELLKEHKKAKHIVYAGAFGDNREILTSNDDNEPKGTAGKSILNAILSTNFTDICILVVRYFGETLLGKGNLSRAYRDSALLAISKFS